MIISIGSTGEQRISAKKFLELTDAGRHSYLKAFPLSRHRSLIKGSDSSPKVPKLKEGKSYSAQEFLALSEKDQKAYIRRNPKTSHVVAEPKVKRAAKKPKVNKSKEVNAKRNSQRKQMEVAGIGSVTKNELSTLPAITSQHLTKAAANIEDRREEVKESIFHQLRDKPELREAGFAGIRRFLNGDKAFDHRELDEDEDGDFDFDFDEDEPEVKRKGHGIADKYLQRDGKAVLNFIIKASLLTCGIALIAAGAGPLAAVIGRGILELSADFKGLAGSDVDDSKTVDDVISSTVSYLRNVDDITLKEVTQKTFAAVANDDYEEYSFELEVDDTNPVSNQILELLRSSGYEADLVDDVITSESAGLEIRIGTDAGTQIGSSDPLMRDSSPDISFNRNDINHINRIRRGHKR